MSALFAFKLVIVCLILTCLVSLRTIVFILIEQSNQISAVQSTLYQLCTQALIDDLESQPTIILLSLSSYFQGGDTFVCANLI